MNARCQTNTKTTAIAWSDFFTTPQQKECCASFPSTMHCPGTNGDVAGARRESMINDGRIGDTGDRCPWVEVLQWQVVTHACLRL
ncbi:unnamed protein product [Haemonchus placei]|uniref:Uncharacterized protein n=1 Tax=Haemonchus placei TaxID=6290 RepID=A0A0N4WNF0_HAEPC|nr:unnamed protein product [Haemonchus placei]